jgi:hypothetical protein
VPRIRVLAAALLVGAVLTGCSLSSVKDEKVALAGVRDAVVVTDGGAERAAADGDILAKGATVRTRAGGTASLVVRGRRVVLGGDTEVTVHDGATVELGGGALLVDRRQGPGVTIEAGDSLVENVGSGAVRVERGYSVLVAGLSAGARVRTATGQKLDLDALYQVVVPGRALPRTALPLQLRHDTWEQDVVPDLLADDERLNDLASGLIGPAAPALPATYREAGGVHRADLVLADAIGRAAARDGAGRRSAAGRARVLRGEGGSWGVVARLLNAAVVDVGVALSEVLRGVPATAADPSASPTTPSGIVAGRTPQPGVTRSPSPGSPSPSKTPKPTEPSESPTEEPTEPTESPDPIEELFSSLPTPPPILP